MKTRTLATYAAKGLIILTEMDAELTAHLSGGGRRPALSSRP